MGRVDDLINLARRLTVGIAELASDLLDAGADPERVHRRFVSAALELFDEAEARAILASVDPDALARLELITGELQRLSAEAAEELADQRRDAPDP